MRNVWLVARREYLERVRTRSFLVMTILIPLLMGGSVFGYYLASRSDSSSAQVAIVVPASQTQFGEDLRTELEQNQRGKMGVDLISPPKENTRAELDGLLQQKELDGYLWVGAASQPGGQPTFVYTPRSQNDKAIKGAIGQAIRVVLTREGLERRGMSAGDATAATQMVDLTEAKRNDHTENAKTSTTVLFFLMYFVILFYGMNVARSIIEEKTSRVFEVMLATIRPEEMLAGKMIGVGSVGLTQVAIWLIAAALLTMTSIVPRLLGASAHISLSGTQIVFFVVFFLLGYLLYSSMAAALGAMTNSEQELQQLNMFLVMPLAGCTVLFPFVFTNPDGILPRIFSLVPFTSPLIMYMRISLKTPAWYEIVASFAILLGTIYAILWTASRIYRVGILMYGKKPNLAEILRWLKYS